MKWDWFNRSDDDRTEGSSFEDQDIQQLLQSFRVTQPNTSNNDITSTSNSSDVITSDSGYTYPSFFSQATIDFIECKTTLNFDSGNWETISWRK